MSPENPSRETKRPAFDPVAALAELRHEFGEHGGVNMSVENSTTFSVLDSKTLPAIFRGQLGPEQGGCFLYGRHFNPTVYNLGKQLARMEGAEAGYCTSSGMGAISSVLLQLCDAGDEIVASDTIYGGTYALMHDYLPKKAGITTRFLDAQDLKAVEAAITPKTKVLYVETISNPMLAVADIPALSAIARKRGVTLVVDNTFAPMLVSPIALGADVVVYSLTKYINGASDIIAGAVCGRQSLIESMMDLHLGSMMLLGPTLDPQSAAAISLRLPHLYLRLREHATRALTFAQRLHDLKTPVIYPGLPGHPGRAVLERIGRAEFGFGGILGIDMGTAERANRFMDLLQNEERFGIMAVSLGYSETLMTCPASTTSSEMTDEDLRKSGISPGLVRMSVGYTGTLEQRWSQLESAIRKLGR